MEIRIVASVQAKLDFIEEVASAVRNVVPLSRQEAGNLQYELHEEINKPGVFVFFERWRDKDAINVHEQTAHFRELVAQLEGKIEGMDIKLLKPVSDIASK
ncbi:putative quinol monooxygenase [Musicola paradisiaca]|uniref:Antibiotic biosynthesis monooxygenase n=1 Tax=Musicola paradisiaca (strain Ech703) TaxID=579405 RepID=C6C3N2_MUSP7|nr:putative quinol monooxygenase [Musicola paradisiaca]ACS85377.1 Antibiotic biosynthesis monooxygenase [Musicola paradisiaca Ech703]